jgi:hypothetical protein
MTEITYNGKEVVKMEVHDEGDFVYIVFKTTDGKMYSTANLRGEVKMKTLKQRFQNKVPWIEEDIFNSLIEDVKEWLTQKRQEELEKPNDRPSRWFIDELLEELKE